MSKLLIVDDELNIRELLGTYAKYEGYDYVLCDNGKKAIDYALNDSFDLIIMDIMMPELDGFQAVKEIRKTKTVPIIFLSSRSEEYDKLYGFDLGADDYITKPFSVKLLFKRINALLKRIDDLTTPIDNKITYKSLVIDIIKRLVIIDDIKVDLTKKEYDLLVLLMKNLNNVVTRNVIMSTIWPELELNDRTLDTHLKSLRKKIGVYANNIITIRKVGYRFETE